MRPYCIDNETGQPQKAGVQQGDVAPPGTKFQFLPRIRCNDCPGKLYTAVPGKVVQDFEVHLRNRGHRETVMKRKEKA
jgi:SWI/SNF-related matrix-associated actin-dependent regulator of chromatin subfamily B protein 1